MCVSLCSVCQVPAPLRRLAECVAAASGERNVALSRTVRSSDVFWILFIFSMHTALMHRAGHKGELEVAGMSTAQSSGTPGPGCLCLCTRYPMTSSLHFVSISRFSEPQANRVSSLE